ncbi:uncharacterized protein STEHIDRAFT_112658 [Stereum hirsutum FP-91666 SS1]|uniref:uncharacterized protein n=1 Tax=Stereum hirsutum (strain FP-91666) TaxID=721885 RepID=UPI0004449DB6|nr:uncharacterized protein STEHIDRAFT_112658 [Stereum hirsutum FP-91666 SS1]EIM84220.1 hypothetical protein STEHIDRAFT_112658 [Stereum hirsutum FP-91666 SS1]
MQLQVFDSLTPPSARIEPEALVEDVTRGVVQRLWPALDQIVLAVSSAAAPLESVVRTLSLTGKDNLTAVHESLQCMDQLKAMSAELSTASKTLTARILDLVLAWSLPVGVSREFAELQARQVTIDLEAVKDSDPVLAGPVSELLVKVKASVLSLEIPVPVTILAAHRVRRTDDMFLLDTKEAADWLPSLRYSKRPSGLQLGTIAGGHWIKVVERRHTTQSRAHSQRSPIHITPQLVTPYQRSSGQMHLRHNRNFVEAGSLFIAASFDQEAVSVLMVKVATFKAEIGESSALKWSGC